MGHERILLTAFRGSSAEKLMEYADGFDVLLLPNDKVKDSEKLIRRIADGSYNYVFGFGQRPNIKNKVHIEMTARSGEYTVETDFDCERLKELFEANGIAVKISHNAGTSYCNGLYYNGLDYIQSNGLKTKMVFIHIPFLKNIENADGFFTKVIHSIDAQKAPRG